MLRLKTLEHAERKDSRMAEELIKAYPNLRIIILSMHATEAFVLEALRAGASGYLLKGAATPELGLAIQAVAR